MAKDYRPDIDGLRALAILAVVAFHVGIRAFHGGFVGVDIFFVISGYLIGGIVYREAKSKTFSFVKFYQRRAKRILPAFFTVLLFCYLVAILILSPAEIRQFAATASAAIFSLSNIQLWLTTGYFTNGSQFNPLLMTWSLAVEEQFYALFPILILAFVSGKRNRTAQAIATGSILSFGLALWGVAHHPTMAFFLLPTRAWELGVGVLLAIRAYEQGSRETGDAGMTGEVLAAIGAILLIGSIAFCRSNQFPGLAALPPVIGTLLVISTPNSFVGNFLSASPLVFVGRLSYSWYLWHWPMLSFARIASDRPVGLQVAILIGIVSFVAALGSFYLVEQPFRHSRTPARPVLVRYASLVLTISTLPLTLVAMKSLPRQQPQLAKLESVEVVTHDKCLAAYGKTTPRLTADCIAGPSEQHIVALIGDSHAATLATTLRSTVGKSGYALDEIDKSSCPPLQTVTSYMPDHAGHDRECAAFNLTTLSYCRANPRVEVVVMAGFWSGPFLQPEDGASFVPIGDDHGKVSEDVSRNNLQEGLESEVEQLLASGKQVILMKDAPVLTFDPVRYEVATFIPMRRDLGKLLLPAPGLATARLYASGRATPYDDRPESAVIDYVAARNPPIRVYDLKKRLCDQGSCAFVDHESLMYLDSNHLSRLGAERALADLNLNSIRQEVATKDTHANSF